MFSLNDANNDNQKMNGSRFSFSIMGLAFSARSSSAFPTFSDFFAYASVDPEYVVKFSSLLVFGLT